MGACGEGDGDQVRERVCSGGFVCVLEMGHEAAGDMVAFEVNGGFLSKFTRFWKKGSVPARDGLPLLLGSSFSLEE